MAGLVVLAIYVLPNFPVLGLTEAPVARLATMTLWSGLVT